MIRSDTEEGLFDPDKSSRFVTLHQGFLALYQSCRGVQPALWRRVSKDQGGQREAGQHEEWPRQGSSRAGIRSDRCPRARDPDPPYEPGET